MARQEIQMIDDSPVVNDQRTQPQPPGQQQGAAGMPNRPVPLPRAGWQPYSSSMPGSMSNSLPKVVNGVPPKAPPPVAVKPQMGKAGAYKGKMPAAKPSGPAVAKTYAPYKGYGGNQPAPVTSSAAGSQTSATTNVQGSLLHWSRTRRTP
jgi:hypothetical protein